MTHKRKVAIFARRKPTFSKLTTINVDISHDKRRVIVKKIHGRKHCKAFQFERVFDEFETQRQVYEQTIGNRISELLTGRDFTIVTHGQSGSGKTHTMFGDRTDAGIVPRTIESIFDATCSNDIQEY